MKGGSISTDAPASVMPVSVARPGVLLSARRIPCSNGGAVEIYAQNCCFLYYGHPAFLWRFRDELEDGTSIRAFSSLTARKF